MNYAAHALTASEVFQEPSDANVFGSMAPDFVGMAGSRLQQEVSNQELADGIQLHLATDRVFNGHPEFIAIKKKYRQIYQESLDNGPSRLLADPGTEMLLDGFVLQKNAGTDAYLLGMSAVNNPGLNFWEAARDSLKFGAYCMKHARIGVPDFYHDPLTVAQRLQRRVQDRPKLQFSESKLPFIAEVMGEQQKDLAVIANELIEDTILQLRTERDDPSEMPEIGPVSLIVPDIAVSVSRVDEQDKIDLRPGERLQPSRTNRANFATGRKAAKTALTKVGYTHADYSAIPKGTQGHPRFPDNFVGSISHTDEWVIAVAAREEDYATVGVDIERADRMLTEKVAQHVATQSELERFAHLGSLAPLVIASIKEAAYKAMWPYAQRYIGFKEVETFSADDSTFVLQPKSDALKVELGETSVTATIVVDRKWLVAVAYSN